MQNIVKSFKSKEQKKRVSTLLSKSKEMNLIKDHIQAFEDVPVKFEEHKGRIK